MAHQIARPSPLLPTGNRRRVMVHRGWRLFIGLIVPAAGEFAIIAPTMQGFFALTDYGWYEHLEQLGASEANFWRPSIKRFAFPSGTPFLFKLKAPYRAIAGFGFFAGFSVLPDWLAWETFAEANGVANLAQLRDRLQRVQAAGRVEADPAGQIGCCLIAETHFFAPDQWVPAPNDWRDRTQVGVRYDLTAGEGMRVWQECIARANAQPPPVSSSRYGEPSLYLPRLGQGIFRVQVLDAYGRACAVTQEHSLPVLEAAHIQPFAFGGSNDVSNGLALRTDIHRLFDRGYVTVDEDGNFVVGRRLREEFENGHSYYGLHGQPLRLPTLLELKPEADALAWHREQMFLG